MRSRPPAQNTPALPAQSAPAFGVRPHWAVRSAYDVGAVTPAQRRTTSKNHQRPQRSRRKTSQPKSSFRACAAADRGFAASPADRAEIERSSTSCRRPPIEEPTRGIADGAADAPLRKCWRLVYTSASDVSTLAANPLGSLGASIRTRELPVVVNVIDSFPVLANLPRKPPRSSRRRRGCGYRRARGPARRRASAWLRTRRRRAAGDPRPGGARLATKTKGGLAAARLDVQRRIFNVGDDEDPMDAASNPLFDSRLDEELVIKQGSPGQHSPRSRSTTSRAATKPVG